MKNDFFVCVFVFICVYFCIINFTNFINFNFSYIAMKLDKIEDNYGGNI